MTGFRSIKIEEFITSHKGKIMASVSGNTTLVIRKDNEESTKVQKAIQLGITILNLSVFESMHNIQASKLKNIEKGNNQHRKRWSFGIRH